jgi:hypothetical protein
VGSDDGHCDVRRQELLELASGNAGWTELPLTEAEKGVTLWDRAPADNSAVSIGRVQGVLPASPEVFTRSH